MRVHTSADYFAIRNTTAGLPGVYIETLEQHGSKTHEHAFELALSGNGRYGGQFGGQFGSASRDIKSATWDEWGVVMARIFALDPNTRMGGSVNRPVYANAEDFRWQTNGRFGGWELAGLAWKRDQSERFVAYGMPADTHPVHRWDWQGYSAAGSYSVAQCRKCSAVKRWKVPERISA